MGAVHLFAVVEAGSHTLNAAQLTLRGDEHLSAFGYTSRGAGDVSGDGLTDILISGYQSESSTGRIHLVSGGPLAR